ncbi:hypothetical protein HMPREF3213_00257 [Heyndrickxia coagulans]|uniref:Uncharacterized protein n=1 Tax=Heyndrickxia coagulans TaxID=1398 RepID=A0A133L1X7_HEYCO|nr:hypothetical protein HMPREF3213_00257 [Heyndrickxia coagulans]
MHHPKYAKAVEIVVKPPTCSKDEHSNMQKAGEIPRPGAMQ